MIKDTIGIIGIGWLGLPLAKEFIAEGHVVKGSTTSVAKIDALKAEGIIPYHIQLSEHKITGKVEHFLKDVTFLIINVPPGLRGEGPKESYVKKMQLLHQEICNSAIKHILFISSTSVYGEVTGDVDEETIPQPTSESGVQLLASENIFRGDQSLNTTILRFAGLIGPSRHPVTILSKKKNLSDGNAPVNLIHRNDCVAIIKGIILEKQWGKVFNGVHPEHPTKKDYYTKIAKARKLKEPDYQIVKNKKYKKIITCRSFLIKKQVLFTSLYS